MFAFFALSCMPLKTLGPIGPRAVGERVNLLKFVTSYQMYISTQHLVGEV